MLLSFQSKLNKLGDYPELPYYIRNKLFYNNLSLFLGIIISIILTGNHIFFEEINPLVLLSLSILITFFLILLTNIYGGIIYSRFFLIYTPILGNTIFIVLTSNNNQIFTNTYMLGSISYALFIFVIIDVKEKFFFISTLIISLITILFTPFAIKFFDLRMIITMDKMNELEQIQGTINFIMFFTISLLLIIKNSREQKLNQNTIEKTLTKIKKNRMGIQKEKQIINELKQTFDSYNIKYRKIELLKKLKSFYADFPHSEASLKVIQLIADEFNLSHIAFHDIKIVKNQEKSQLLHCLVDNQKQDNTITFEKKEGLVGTVMQKYKSILTKNLPNNFMYVENKNNQFPPRYHYLYPLMNNKTMYGVIEFVRNIKITDDQNEFLNHISVTFAQEIYYHRASEKIRNIKK